MAARAKSPVYRIYLLTAWQVQSQAQTAETEWRFHLTDPRTGRRYGFTNAAGLLIRLQELANAQPAGDEDR